VRRLTMGCGSVSGSSSAVSHLDRFLDGVFGRLLDAWVAMFEEEEHALK